MSSKSNKEVLQQFMLLQRYKRLAEQYCPEMLEEMVSSEEDIRYWVSRFLDRLPEDIRKQVEND